MGMIPNYEELQGLSDQDLIERYNAAAQNTVVGTGFYTEELSRRKTDRQNSEMLKINQSMKTMTILITILTVVNVALVGYTLLK
jgi:hypothetical protein